MWLDLAEGVLTEFCEAQWPETMRCLAYIEQYRSEKTAAQASYCIDYWRRLDPSVRSARQREFRARRATDEVRFQRRKQKDSEWHRRHPKTPAHALSPEQLARRREVNRRCSAAYQARKQAQAALDTAVGGV